MVKAVHNHPTINNHVLTTLRFTTPWHWHTTNTCPAIRTFGAYTRLSFPDQNTTQPSSRSSSRTFFLKPPLPSQWHTIPFSPTSFLINLSFWGKFSLTLLCGLQLYTYRDGVMHFRQPYYCTIIYQCRTP